MRVSIILLLSLFLFTAIQQQTGPTIYYVSGDPSTIQRPVLSSLRGGALIYIQVTGHNPMPSGNKVFVGTFPCLIPADGVTDTFITCETSDSGSDSDILDLPVTLISYSIPFTTSSPNLVRYVSVVTPQLD